MKYLLKIVIIVFIVIFLSPSWASDQVSSPNTKQATSNIQNNTGSNTVKDNATNITAKSQKITEAKEKVEASMLTGINKIITLLDQSNNSNYNIILWIQSGIFLFQLGVFFWQGIQLKRSVDLNRAWVFAGCGETKLVRPGVVRVHPDHRNNGASPAFVEYIFIDFLPKSKPLPESPPYKTKYPIVNPLQPDKAYESVLRQGWMEYEISEDMYIFGRIFYRDAFRRKGTQRHSSFIYLIKLDLNGDHIRPLRDQVPPAYWEWI